MATIQLPSFLSPVVGVVPSFVFQAALVLGSISLVLFVLNFLHFVYRYFVRSGINPKKFGSWAVVTGCTDGIGLAISEELAKKGVNIVLISRSQQKLTDVAKQIESKYKVQTKTVAVDFASNDPTIFDAVKREINGLEVGILVNNVGVGYDHAEYFANLSPSKINDLIRVNVYGTVQMTYLVLPQMVQRKKGVVVNVSSASSFVSEPMYAVYAGTKAFINNFTVALHYEYKDQGIKIQCAVPAFVSTKLSKIRHSSFFVCSPRGYAQAFLRQLAYEPLSVTYWTHALQIAVGSLLPGSFIAKTLLSRGKDIRRRALAKKEVNQQ